MTYEKMELIYDAPVGTRIKRSRFIGTTAGWTARRDEVPTDRILWWNMDRRRWELYKDCKGCNISSHCDEPRSVKAFLRHVKKHRMELAGYRISLHSRFIGHDIHIDVPTLEEQAA